MKINEQGRQAIIVALAQRALLGRTAVMKLMFFLQELRGVQLSYDFRIYTYGPYDGQVLEDLRLTEAHGGVVCNRIQWNGGSGVEIVPGINSDEIVLKQKSLVLSLATDLDWVVDKFGKKTASDLEVLSTIVFVYQDMNACVEKEILCTKVHTLKPQHSLEKIAKEVENLTKLDVLCFVC